MDNKNKIDAVIDEVIGSKRLKQLFTTLITFAAIVFLIFIVGIYLIHY